MITLQELKEKMKREDEVSLLELLDITSEDLVEMFEHRIDARYEVLIEEYDDNTSE